MRRKRRNEGEVALEGINSVPKGRRSDTRNSIDQSYFAIRDKVVSDIILTDPKMSIAEVAKITGYQQRVVGAISQKLALRKLVQERNSEIKRELLEDKVPILKEIASLSLTALRDYLLEMTNPLVKEERIKTLSDAKILSSITKDLNEVLRLELGQATSIEKKDVQLSIDQTRQIFVELSQADPVFDYPKQLTDGRTETIEISVSADPAPCRNNENDILLHEDEGRISSSGSGESS